jgi:hypothetical protein
MSFLKDPRQRTRSGPCGQVKILGLIADTQAEVLLEVARGFEFLSAKNHGVNSQHPHAVLGCRIKGLHVRRLLRLRRFVQCVFPSPLSI